MRRRERGRAVWGVMGVRGAIEAEATIAGAGAGAGVEAEAMIADLGAGVEVGVGAMMAGIGGGVAVLGSGAAEGGV